MPVTPTEAWLREGLAREAPPPLTTGDGWLWRPGTVPRSAAVLIPVIAEGDELRVLFTVRTDHLHDHAGQISFPGGRSEPEDATPHETALRECSEEVGVPPARIEVLSALSDYLTVTGYRVTPVVGLIRAPLSLALDPFEVAEVFEVPLGFLLDPRNHQRNRVVHEGRERHYYAVPFGRRYIWGATAGMLMNLCRQLGTSNF